MYQDLRSIYEETDASTGGKNDLSGVQGLRLPQWADIMNMGRQV